MDLWEVEDLTLPRGARPAVPLPAHNGGKRDFPGAHGDSTQLREGQHRLWGQLLDLKMSLRMLSLTLEGCGRGDPTGQGQSECSSL